MIPRFCWVSTAVVALLTVASVCPVAAEPNYAPGKGGVGGMLGGSTFRLDRTLGSDWFGDYSEGAQARFALNANFRYVMSRRLRWQVSPGFTWSAYSDVAAPFADPNFPAVRTKEQQLTLLAPVTAQIQYTVRRGSWIYHGGIGPGLYRVWVENDRKVLKDPVTFKLHRGIYPGAVVQFGAEKFFKGITNLSTEFSLADHLVFAQRKEQFVSGYDSNLMATELRIGVNYYFDMVRQKKAAPAAGAP
jgi:hypothetical protein